MKFMLTMLIMAMPVSVSAETEQFIFDVNDQPDRHLQVNLLHGGIVVRGVDGNQVNVTADFEESGAGETSVGESGMRSLPNMARDFQANHDDGEIVIRAGTVDQAVNMVVQVPYDMRLTLRVSQNGNIRVEGVSGEMDLQNSSGRIDLKDLQNSIVAHAQSDEITARFASANLTGPSSFSSWSGNVEISLQADTPANLRWRSNYGEVMSSFEVEEINTISSRKDSGGSSRVEGFTTGSINGGGPEISATSYSGNVIFKFAEQ